MSKRELRVLNLKAAKPLELRNVDGRELPNIVGYTATYNQETRIGGKKYGFREIIRPGFFTKALMEKHDVRALFNHDSNFILGRSASGTLSMREDETGLFVEIEPADTQAGRDTVTSIERGDVDGMSFAFTVNKVRWEQNDEDPSEDLRELLEIDQLFDVGPVVYPAYESTSADTKSFRSAHEILKEEQKREDNMDKGIVVPFGRGGIVPDLKKFNFSIDIDSAKGLFGVRQKSNHSEEAKRRERELELIKLGAK